MFVSCLTEPLRKQVKLCRPRTLDEAMQLAVQIEDEQLEIAMETQSPHEQMTHTIPVPSTVQIKNGLADPSARGNVKAPAAARQRARYGKQPVAYGAREQEVPRYGHHCSSASMQVAGAPKNAGMLKAYLSSYLKSYVADRTPSTPEAMAYAARCQSNAEANYSTQRGRTPAESHPDPNFAGRQAVNVCDTADLGTAQSSWQAPLEQFGPSDYDAAWQAEAAGVVAETHTSMPEVATSRGTSADEDVSDTSSSCDLSLAALEVESEQHRTEAAAPANSIQTIGAVATQESTAEHDDHAVETAVTDLDSHQCEQFTAELSSTGSTGSTVHAEAPVQSPDATESEVHCFEADSREDQAGEQTLPALHIPMQTALRDGPATETGVSSSAGVDSDPLGGAAQVHVAPFLSAPEESLPGACRALLPVPSATPLQPEITRDSCSNDVTSWTLSKGTPVYHFEQDGNTVISTKRQWAVQAILRLLPGCYLRYGYSSHAFLSPPGGPWYYHVQVLGVRPLVFPR